MSASVLPLTCFSVSPLRSRDASESTFPRFLRQSPVGQHSWVAWREGLGNSASVMGSIRGSGMVDHAVCDIFASSTFFSPFPPQCSPAKVSELKPDIEISKSFLGLELLKGELPS